jgi:hypothetical protein
MPEFPSPSGLIGNCELIADPAAFAEKADAASWLSGRAWLEPSFMLEISGPGEVDRGGGFIGGGMGLVGAAEGWRSRHF